MKRFIFAGVLLLDAFAAAQAFSAPSRPVILHATLTGAAETPPQASSGAGDVDALLDPATKVLSYTVHWRGLTGPAIASRLEGPAASGPNPAIVQALGAQGATVQGTVTLTDDQANAVQAGGFYLNLPTRLHPAGEIRGQLVPIV